jgi:glycerol-3-phosphate acyltransferase PlsY
VVGFAVDVSAAIPLVPITAAIAMAVGYLAGSIPFGVLFARARGVDLQQAGSGNIGATNAARVLGKKIGAIVLLCDALKGFGPVFAVRLLWLDATWGPEVIAAVGLLAILGHVLPVWLRFKGGKGVATGFGVFLAIAPLAALAAFVVYATVYAIWRISSIGSLTSATAFVIVVAALGLPRPFLGLAAAAWLVILVKHRDNIRRLLRREEKKI